jgi:hypothetical protein
MKTRTATAVARGLREQSYSSAPDKLARYGAADSGGFRRACSLRLLEESKVNPGAVCRKKQLLPWLNVPAPPHLGRDDDPARVIDPNPEKGSRARHTILAMVY